MTYIGMKSVSGAWERRTGVGVREGLGDPHG